MDQQDVPLIHAIQLYMPSVLSLQPSYLQMLAALPAGWLADQYRRDFVLKGAAALGMVAAATLAIALLYQLPVQSLFGACALLGIYTGFNNAPFEALFADCIQRGKRHVPSPPVSMNAGMSQLSAMCGW